MTRPESLLHAVDDVPPHGTTLALDETTLEVALACRGDLPSLPTRRPVSEDDLIEGQPSVKGLAGFLVGVYPDRARTNADEGQCRIELVFDV